MNAKHRILRRDAAFFIIAGIFAALLPLLFPIAQWIGLNREQLNWLDMIGFLAFFYSLPIILIFIITGSVFVFMRKDVFVGITLVVLGIAGIFSYYSALKQVKYIRHDAFARLAERSAPLVNALRQFEHDTGQPAPDLEALVPEYLAGIPGTGIPKYPKYEYSAKSYTPPNTWQLQVSTLFGLGFDSFLYLPEQNYPERGYGGRLERIGDWAYVHE